ncbi:MAG: phosphatidylserine/phosphatidylglycerophosphate/cardiolipin synthase family protein [Proteobacteria bacterium]|nr:phosphatidylserine/phosphatidylglycerophosphate/cardiolipin synthase family protein [Pseudomonadota bacterium]
MLFDIGAILAMTMLGYLVYLALFERGAFYTASEQLHTLDDNERLRMLSAVLATPIQPIESVQLINEGAELYQCQVKTVSTAQHSVHCEAYIFRAGDAADALLQALCERARNGVRVRVMIDGIGSLGTRNALFDSLIAAGGEVRRYHPIHWHLFRRWNNRTHRNLLVVDGVTAFVGGAGVADQWFRPELPWRDCQLRITGPVAAGLQAVFAENWLECTGQMLVGPDSFPRVDPLQASPSVVSLGIAVGSSPTAGGSTRARVLFQLLLASASETIDLSSPYFIPDLGIRQELLAARNRGVRVRILTSGRHNDHRIARRAGRRRYGLLLEGGIEISEFSTRMMHAKVLVVDGRWSIVGSTNIDNRSFRLNDEVNLLVLDQILGTALQQAFEDDLAHSVALDLESWRRRSWTERALALLGRVLERHH